jgi:hypothetical protein
VLATGQGAVIEAGTIHLAAALYRGTRIDAKGCLTELSILTSVNPNPRAIFGPPESGVSRRSSDHNRPDQYHREAPARGGGHLVIQRGALRPNIVPYRD